MLKILKKFAILPVVLSLLSSPALAEPIKLRMAFFSSDMATFYRYVIVPFINAVNAEAKGLLEIEGYPGGTLGKPLNEQPQMVQRGVADIAFALPGQTPQLFPDNTVVELPGMFENLRESGTVVTRLIAANALSGYENFVVIGVFMSQPGNIHTRPPVTSLRDLNGLRIAAANQIQADALEKIGIRPVLMPVPLISEAISSGKIDGGIVAPGTVFEFGIGRVATNHYLLPTGASILALLMNREKFDGLPERAKAIIRKYSGEWILARYLEFYVDDGNKQMDQLKADTKRKTITPTQEDLKTAQSAFNSAIEKWAAESTHNQELLHKAEVEIARVRAGP